LLARALVKNPPLLILDEPTQGMDDEQVREFVNLIDEISIDKTLLYVSHYENEVPSCINSKLELAKGKASVTTINHTKTEAA
jgi:molybdate transport system ATP-binding protein